MSEKTRVSKISIGRLHNLGNFEHIRYEVTVDLSEDEDAGKVFSTLESLLNDVQVKHGVSDYSYEQAKRILAKPSEQLSDGDIRMIPEYRETVQKVEETHKRRAMARAALSTLNYSSEYTDHKDKWEDEY